MCTIRHGWLLQKRPNAREDDTVRRWAERRRRHRSRNIVITRARTGDSSNATVIILYGETCGPTDGAAEAGSESEFSVTREQWPKPFKVDWFRATATLNRTSLFHFRRFSSPRPGGLPSPGGLVGWVAEFDCIYAPARVWTTFATAWAYRIGRCRRRVL